MKNTHTKLWYLGLTTAEREETAVALRGLVDDALNLIEEARKSAINGNFLNAALAFSQATNLYDMYIMIMKKMGRLLPEFEEITVSFKNAFKSDVNRIEDAIG